MATKKALPAKSGGQDKKSPGTPAKRTRKNMSRGEILELQDTRMRRIWSVVLFAVGILFLCIALIEGEDNDKYDEEQYQNYNYADDNEQDRRKRRKKVTEHQIQYRKSDYSEQSSQAGIFKIHIIPLLS